MHRYTVVTLFPELIAAFAATGIVGRCAARSLIAIDSVNPRDFALDRRATVDDAPYGGGPGMVMMVPPLRAAIGAARGAGAGPVIYLSPQGRRLQQRDMARLGGIERLILVAGRYEGIDERVLDRDIDEEWSIGDFVVSGGEVPAMLMIDAIVRTLPQALGDARSAHEDSFSAGLLDYPHYTRPETVDDQPVPSLLLGGNHAAIAAWRRGQQLARTWRKRPDLLPATLTAADWAQLESFLRDADGD